MQRISFNSTLTIGLMLFALFFGAGNLVFPAMMGQHAGDQYWQANLGFLITGVGLPLLGTLALGFSGSKSLLALTSRVHPWFAFGYTTLLYLTIGPLFAMPRTGSVAYEIGIKPYIEAGYGPLGLAISTVLFFGVTLLLAINPAKMVDIVGRILTPLLITCIALLAIASLMAPLGQPQAPEGGYVFQAFFNGFQEGYLTMDALAAFVFGIIVVDAIRAKGVSARKGMLTVCFQAAMIAAAMLALIYTSLTYIGASSVSAFGMLANGGTVLNLVTSHYFGTFGGFVLGLIVLLACLTTSIGLTAACSSYFHQIMPSLSYKSICVVLSVVSALLANIGLEQLIHFSVPVLTILYPLAIVLILLTFLHHGFKGKRAVYAVSLLLTFLVSLVDGLEDTPLGIHQLHDFFNRHLPLYSIGLGWLIPACAGMLIGLLLPERQAEQPSSSPVED
ncbi:branched-chain amino acid:cation transporter, LIVCS family [Paenibacillus sp. UNCCL117]|uniref:branched-chain amino acid transport system II carrier protein n=1 Tax=unclassified Paenibacillus TaxID=185978 RepID=UPI0008873D96|nr:MULTISPECIES: branched-chain amino acid transport system II carrier protein [unclassified Paenibacillus]SDD83284.1 branched-chain amino acid:cation transporter, LIVCS family [Paenibacillus sp. cl123]SFW54917.1 branched-chain amino acid:cation transporter, LIVCS family [Paenibacillus sp. UNCCL117]